MHWLKQTALATLAAVLIISVVWIPSAIDGQTFGSEDAPLESLTLDTFSLVGNRYYVQVGTPITVYPHEPSDGIVYQVSDVTSGYGLTRYTNGDFVDLYGVTVECVKGTLSKTGEVTISIERGSGSSFSSFGFGTIVIVDEPVTVPDDVRFDSTGGTEATVGYQYQYNVQTTPYDATISISGVTWLSVSGHIISGTPTSAGSYTLTITASADGFTSATQTVVIVVVDEPVTQGAPTISGVSYSVDNSNPYRLTFSIIADDASSIVVDYGDGTSGTGAMSTHTYTSSGSYVVRAVASNSIGTATTTISVLIADRTPGSSVQYNHQYTFTLGIDAEGLTPTITGCPFLSVSAGSNYVTVSGTPGSTAYVGKTYDVILRVGDFTMSWNLTVTEGSTVPKAGFTVKTDGLTVTVTSTASNADQTFYLWTSGGNFVQSNTTETKYTFPQAGTYQITQRVTATIDGRTMTDEYSATVTVTAMEQGEDAEDEEVQGIMILAGIAMAILGLVVLIGGAVFGSYTVSIAGAIIAVLGAVMWWLI